MRFSELFNQGSNGKGFPLDANQLRDPITWKSPVSQIINFFYEKGPEKTLKINFLLFVRKWIQKLTHWRPFSSTKPCSTATMLIASFTGGPKRAGGSRQQNVQAKYLGFGATEVYLG